MIGRPDNCNNEPMNQGVVLGERTNLRGAWREKNQKGDDLLIRKSDGGGSRGGGSSRMAPTLLTLLAGRQWCYQFKQGFRP